MVSIEDYLGSQGPQKNYQSAAYQYTAEERFRNRLAAAMLALTLVSIPYFLFSAVCNKVKLERAKAVQTVSERYNQTHYIWGSWK